MPPLTRRHFLPSGGLLIAWVLTAGAGLAEAQTFLELEEQVLETEVERPEAFFFRQPMPLEYVPRPPRSSFLEELFLTVEDDPSI